MSRETPRETHGSFALRLLKAKVLTLALFFLCSLVYSAEKLSLTDLPSKASAKRPAGRMLSQAQPAYVLPAWVSRYPDTNIVGGWGVAMAVDGSGNVYLTGTSASGESAQDYLTVKYNSTGKLLWAARYNGPANTNDIAKAIAVDRAGNVYVAGTSDITGVGEDYATVKYDPNGHQVWVARHGGPAFAFALAVDEAGNIYVTGAAAFDSSSGGYLTIKYDPNGKEIWTAQYAGPTRWNLPYYMQVDSAGNVYVTGESDGVGTGSDYATVKYDPNGQQI